MADVGRRMIRLMAAMFFCAAFFVGSFTVMAAAETGETALCESEADDMLAEQSSADAADITFTREELECIEQNETYTIYFDNYTQPLTWYDEETESHEGVLEDICRELANQTGLKFEFKSSQELPKKIGAYDVTYHTLAYNELNNDQKYYGGTDSVLDEEYSLFHVKGREFDADSTANYTVNVVKNRDGIYSYFENNYPNYKVQVCDTPEQCIQKLKQGKADFAFLNNYVANNVFVELDVDNIEQVPTRSMSFGIALQFYGEKQEILAGIVNKGIRMLDQKRVQSIILEYALNTTPNVTAVYLIKNNLALVLVVFVTVLILIMLIVLITRYATVMKKQKIKVELANSAKTEFFSRMSHDMRTPMNGILGLAALSEQESDVQVLQKNISKIKDSGQYLLGLINDTLDFQRIESGKLTLEPQIVYMKDMLNNIINMVRSTAQKKQIDFRISVSEKDLKRYVKIDPLRTSQIFVNLLSNAIKFTPEHGKVTFEIRNMGCDGNILHACICISDTGVGMSRDFMQNSLYQPFAQEQNAMSTQYAGSGLGLSIVKSLVELMHARIEVNSTIGEGTVFTIYMDFEEVDEQEAVDSSDSKEKRQQEIRQILSGKCILLCEDHPLNAEIAVKLLENVGCEVVWAENGQEGAACFQASAIGKFQAILMDIRMPVMNGLETAKAIRASDHADAKTIPIIAMTANAYDEDVKHSLAAGMNAHLGKPIEPQKLYELLVKYLE